jgi:hypothetical protein
VPALSITDTGITVYTLTVIGDAVAVVGLAQVAVDVNVQPMICPSL